jgi:hypothetical protein
VIYQHLPHGARSDGQKVRSVGGDDTAARSQLQVNLVDQAGGMERVSGPLSGQLRLRQASKLVVQQGHKPIDSLPISLSRCHEQLRDLSAKPALLLHQPSLTVVY